MQETLSSYDQMLDTVADAIVDPQNAHLRDQLILFLEKVQLHTIDVSCFESSLKRLLSQKDSEACSRIIGGIRKRCERYLGSAMQFGKGFPEWAQKKHATVVHINSQSVIMDFNNHKIRPLSRYVSHYCKWPERMNQGKFLENLDSGKIWVATPAQLIEQRRVQIMSDIDFHTKQKERHAYHIDVLLAEFSTLDIVD